MLSFCTFTYAQGEYNICYFNTAGIDFNGGNPLVLTNSQMGSTEASASMCSPNGELLFYSNGGHRPGSSSYVGAVWNANHQIMENGVLGDSSGCASSFDGAVAFPKLPNSSNFNNAAPIGNSTYYIFMRDCVESSYTSPNYNSGLTYCEIDMDANNGLGKVVSKGNIVVPFDPGYGGSTNHEPLAAISNENEDGWYVFSYNLDSLYSIEVNNSGIGNLKTHVAGERRIIFSPSKEHVLVGNKLYKYDVSNNELLFISTISEKFCAFSPNGKLLYGFDSDLLVQFDLTALDILASRITIGPAFSANRLFLAPDARIYLTQTGGYYLLGAINCPNSLGVNCDLTMDSLYLSGNQFGHALTNIPANYLYYNGADCNLSVKENQSKKYDFKIFPNPSNGIFTISMSEFKESKTLQVSSLEGKVVYNGELLNSNSEIDLSFVDAAVYIVEVMGVRKKLVLR